MSDSDSDDLQMFTFLSIFSIFEAIKRGEIGRQFSQYFYMWPS